MLCGACAYKACCLANLGIYVLICFEFKGLPFLRRQ